MDSAASCVIRVLNERSGSQSAIAPNMTFARHVIEPGKVYEIRPEQKGAVTTEYAVVRLEKIDDRITRTNAKEVLEAHLVDGRPVAEIVAERGFQKISDTSALDALVDEVLAANPAAVADVAAGKPQAIGFLVGQVMKVSKGQANAALVQAAIRERVGG